MGSMDEGLKAKQAALFPMLSVSPYRLEKTKNSVILSEAKNLSSI
jgi:hypothetical protein